MSTVDISKRIDSFFEEIISYPTYPRIVEKIPCVQKEIGHEFKDIHLLMLAFCRTKSDQNYINEPLAQIGDFVLTLVIGELYFSQGKEKQDIQAAREKHACNKKLYALTIQKDLAKFCYHQKHFYDDPNVPDDEKVSVNSHDTIIEAIIGAIYFDGGLDKAKEWCMKYVLTKE